MQKNYLAKFGLNIKINEEESSTNSTKPNNNDKVILEQIPKEGIKLDKGGYVVCNIN